MDVELPNKPIKKLMEEVLDMADMVFTTAFLSRAYSGLCAIQSGKDQRYRGRRGRQREQAGTNTHSQRR